VGDGEDFGETISNLITMNNDLIPEEFKLKHISNELFRPDDHTHVATLGAYDDLFHIYFNEHTTAWTLVIEKAPLKYRSYALTEKSLNTEHYTKNNFDKLTDILNTIMEKEYQVIIRQEQKKHRNLIPNWIFLEKKYLNPAFIKHFREHMDHAFKNIRPEALNKDEKTVLKHWDKILISKSK
jgi:hypothetical protein